MSDPTTPTPNQSAVLLRDYEAVVRQTDRFGDTDLYPLLLGLFGEVGGVMAAVKKHKREGGAFAGFRQAVEEELGDALWYFTAVCRRAGTSAENVFGKVAANNSRYKTAIAASGLPEFPLSAVSTVADMPQLDEVLASLGKSAANLLTISSDSEVTASKLVGFADNYLHALQASSVSFAETAAANTKKIRSRFIKPDYATLPTFDQNFPEDEKIPSEFTIVIKERRSGQCAMQWNGVFLGDPLTDNIRDPDGYRFHDVFHFAHAAVLHWSPTFRALIKYKRKSDVATDEAQDGGRAIVIEEGLSAWIFSRAKQLNLFEGQTGVSFDLLKTISQFVSGYEVEACPASLWEDAILQGYEVFRKVRVNCGGIISCSRLNRRITYSSLERRP